MHDLDCYSNQAYDLHHATAELPMRRAQRTRGGACDKLRLRAASCAQMRRAGMPLDQANYANLIHQASKPGHLGFAVQVRPGPSAVVLP